MITAADAIEQFRSAMQAAGIEPPDRLVDDGMIHRFGTNGRADDDAGWYTLHLDGLPAGAFGCWRSYISRTWRADVGRKLTESECAAHKACIAKIKAVRKVEEEHRRAEARKRAAEIWEASPPALDDHAYLKAKVVKAHGVRAHYDRLIVPMYDASGELHSLQFIDGHGGKRFLTGGRVTACYYTIGKSDGLILIAEGFATGAALYEATGCAVAVAFNAGNLEAVAKALRARDADIRLIVCADDDAGTEGNPGVTKAGAAATAVGTVVAVPDFGPDRSAGATDFNDLAKYRGLDAVKACIDEALNVIHPLTKTPLDDITLLDDVRKFIGRFCAFPSPACLDAVTLWAAHAHMVEHFYTTPRLALLSPEPGSGKTRVLEVLDLLTPESMYIFSPSPAALFRTLEQIQVTLLFDECDAIFSKRGDENQHEDLRALINSGYKRGASIPRCVGPRHEVQKFKVFAATALAGLGDLPDTVMSRAVIIRMRKRSAAERIEPFRTRIHETPGHALRDRLAAWAAIVGAAAGAVFPELPPGVEDRKAEIWEPLIAVADQAGGHWPEFARKACVELCAVAEDRRASLGVRLLGDLRTIFAGADALPTTLILARLCGAEPYTRDKQDEPVHIAEDAPWCELRGKPLDSRGLARLLHKYGVGSTKIKYAGQPLQGYRRDDLWDAWQRYLSFTPGEAEPAEPTERAQQSRGFPGDSEVPDKSPVPEPLARSGTRNSLQDKGGSASSVGSAFPGGRGAPRSDLQEGML